MPPVYRPALVTIRNCSSRTPFQKATPFLPRCDPARSKWRESRSLQELAVQHVERETVVRLGILPLCALSTERQFLAQVTNPKVFVIALQELAAQHVEFERVVGRATFSARVLRTKRHFLAQVTNPQVFVNA